MATEAQTAMDKADMKRLLVRSKQEPVNCAIGVGDDKSVGLLLLHRIRAPKALQADLQKEFPGVFNTRHGTALVDTEEDPKLVKFLLNKPVTSMARRLVKTLKGTGFSKVQILAEDGTPVESAAEEEEAAADGATSPTGKEETGLPPSPPPEAEAQPDAAALTAMLGMLAGNIAAVVDPSRKEALARLAREAQGHLKIGNLTYAAAGIESLRRALNPGPAAASDGNPPVPPPSSPQAGSGPDDPRAAQYRAAFDKLKPALDKVAQAVPYRRDVIDAQAAAFMAAMSGGDYAAAREALMELGVLAKPPATADAASPAAAVDYATPRLAWLAARKKVASELDKLHGEIIATYRDSDRVADLDEAYRSKVAPILEALDESLADTLAEADGARDPAKRDQAVANARTIMQRYQSFLTSAPILVELDRNPFVPLSIQQTLSATLAVLGKAVR